LENVGEPSALELSSYSSSALRLARFDLPYFTCARREKGCAYFSSRRGEALNLILKGPCGGGGGGGGGGESSYQRAAIVLGRRVESAHTHTCGGCN